MKPDVKAQAQAAADAADKKWVEDFQKALEQRGKQSPLPNTASHHTEIEW